MKKRIIIIGDFLKDLDDEHTLALLSGILKRDASLELACVIGNLAPAMLRAQGAKGTLQQLGLGHAPVGVGSAVFEGKVHPYESAVPYLAGESEVDPDGLALLVKTLESSEDGQVILVLQSGFTDAADLLRGHAALCVSKISSVAMMAGVVTADEKVKLDDEGFISPNNANNITFDSESGAFVYRTLQDLGIPMVITTRDSAYACQIPFTVYDQMEATGNPVGACLKGRQKPSLQGLWEAACSESGSKIRGTLPDDRNRGWFVKVFCGGKDPGIGDGEDIWPFVGAFNLYDPVNLVAAIPSLREEYFAPDLVEVKGVGHLVIGVSSGRHGLKDVDGLRRFLVETEVSGLS